MAGQSTRGSQPELVLFIGRNDPDSREAVMLLRDFKPWVVERNGKDEETIMPWLNTPTSNYYGLDHIKGYVDYERKIKRESQIEFQT